LDEKSRIPSDFFEGKPVIGICNTWSELTPCNAHFRDLAEAVKKAFSKQVASLSNFQ
jgi:dihydroxyacid dehydratase/phosphogluconate dehydratase